jgi:hypothetical protein
LFVYPFTFPLLVSQILFLDLSVKRFKTKLKMKLSIASLLAMGATGFQPTTFSGRSTALSASTPMGGPGMPPPTPMQNAGPGMAQPGQDGGLSGQSRPSGPGGNMGQDQARPVILQGGSLKTWSLPSTSIQSVQLLMKTEGRPLDGEIELWQGPDNTPYKLRIYVEDGAQRTFSVVVPAPRGPNTVCVRNTAHMEFPLMASVNPSLDLIDIAPKGEDTSTPRTIQGGALRTYPYNPDVQSVKVLLSTDGRPLNARIELLQGPNNIKQVMELYTEDGMERPFLAIVETPGAGNVVRIVNTATMEFPLTCTCEPHLIGPEQGSGMAAMGGDMNMGAEWFLN